MMPRSTRACRIWARRRTPESVRQDGGRRGHTASTWRICGPTLPNTSSYGMSSTEYDSAGMSHVTCRVSSPPRHLYVAVCLSHAATSLQAKLPPALKFISPAGMSRNTAGTTPSAPAAASHPDTTGPGRCHASVAGSTTAPPSVYEPSGSLCMTGTPPVWHASPQSHIPYRTAVCLCSRTVRIRPAPHRTVSSGHRRQVYLGLGEGPFFVHAVLDEHPLAYARNISDTPLVAGHTRVHACRAAGVARRCIRRPVVFGALAPVLQYGRGVQPHPVAEYLRGYVVHAGGHGPRLAGLSFGRPDRAWPPRSPVW